MSFTRIETTGRGFKIYGRFPNHDGDEVCVTESSGVGDPCVWIQSTGPRSHYFDETSAKSLIAALQRFVDDAADPDNWHNDPDYVATWRTS